LSFLKQDRHTQLRWMREDTPKKQGRVCNKATSASRGISILDIKVSMPNLVGFAMCIMEQLSYEMKTLHDYFFSSFYHG